MASPMGVILSSINKKTELLDQEYIEEHYVPFVINRSLSYFYDCVLLVNEMNKRSTIPVYDQYLFYYHAITRKSRFSKWHKTSQDKYLSVVMDYYDYSSRKAEAALKLLSGGQCKSLALTLDTGGKK